MLATEPFFTTLLKEARTAPDEFDEDPTTENICGRSRPKFCIGKLQISLYSQRLPWVLHTGRRSSLLRDMGVRILIFQEESR
jgi:hypothetical protein